MMHIQGTPQTMQVDPHYDNVVEEVKNFLNFSLINSKNLGLLKILSLTRDSDLGKRWSKIISCLVILMPFATSDFQSWLDYPESR